MMSSNIESKPKRASEAAVPHSKGRSNSSETDTLLWRIKARLENKPDQGHIIAMTSCGRNSGVSTLLANLSIQAAKNHMGPVLLIDANITAPKQHRLFRHKTTLGLVDVMVGSVPPHEAIFPTTIESLDIMPSGLPGNLNTARVISENAEEMFHWACERYSLIVVDLPQIDELRHELMIARQADMVLVSIRSNSVRRSYAAQCVERLASDGVKVAGSILSRQTQYTPKILRS